MSLNDFFFGESAEEQSESSLGGANGGSEHEAEERPKKTVVRIKMQKQAQALFPRARTCPGIRTQFEFAKMCHDTRPWDKSFAPEGFPANLNEPYRNFTVIVDRLQADGRQIVGDLAGQDETSKDKRGKAAQRLFNGWVKEKTSTSGTGEVEEDEDPLLSPHDHLTPDELMIARTVFFIRRYWTVQQRAKRAKKNLADVQITELNEREQIGRDCFGNSSSKKLLAKVLLLTVLVQRTLPPLLLLPVFRSQDPPKLAVVRRSLPLKLTAKKTRLHFGWQNSTPRWSRRRLSSNERAWKRT